MQAIPGELSNAVTGAQRDGDERLRFALQCAGIGMWDWDLNLGRGRVTPENQRLFGLPVEQLDPVAADYDRLMHPEDRERVARAFRGAGEQGGAYDAEYRIYRADDGAERWIQSSGRVMALDGGAHFIGISRDITARKQADDELKLSEERLRRICSLMEAVTGGAKVLIATVDKDLRYTFFNEAHREEIKRLTGKDNKVGMSMRELLADLPPEQQAALEAWGRALQGETSERWLEFGAHDYRRVYRALHTPIRDALGRVIGAGEVTQDVTDQIQRETALQTRKDELRRNTLDALPAEVAVLDAQGRIVVVNRRWREFAARNKAPAALRAGTGVDYLGACRQGAKQGDAQSSLAAERLEAVLRGTSDTAEMEYTCHGPRQHRWFLMKAARLPEGGAVVAHLNITPSKQAELKLRELSATLEERVRQRTAQLLESEVTARALMENPVDSVYLLDRQGRLLDLNQTMARRLKQARHKLIGQRLFRLLPPKVARLRRAKLAEVFQTAKPAQFEDERNGRWVDQVYTPVFSLAGTVAKVAVVARDVTRRKQAELAQARLAAIVESSGDAITAMSLDGKIMNWNKAAERLYGFTEAEAVGQPVSLILPPERRREMRRMLSALRRGESLSFETERLHKDGRRIPVALTISPVREAVTGRIIKGSGIARDISERQRLEAEILRAAEAERQRLGQDLHDTLSQQLTSISLHSSVLEQTLAAAQRPEAEQARKVGERVRQALASSRGLAGAMYAVSLQSQGLGPALSELAKSVREMFSIPCVVYCPRDIAFADEDLSRQLYRIAQEAAYNAAKHSRGSQIRIELRARKHRLQLVVTDDGVGATEEQLRNSHMGVTLMRYRAGLIGADLQIKGRPGKGTVVACTLARRNFYDNHHTTKELETNRGHQRQIPGVYRGRSPHGPRGHRCADQRTA